MCKQMLIFTHDLLKTRGHLQTWVLALCMKNTSIPTWVKVLTWQQSLHLPCTSFTGLLPSLRQTWGLTWKWNKVTLLLLLFSNGSLKWVCTFSGVGPLHSKARRPLIYLAFLLANPEERLRPCSDYLLQHWVHQVSQEDWLFHRWDRRPPNVLCTV